MEIKRMQCLLYAAGIDPGPIDGIDGPKTQAALAKVKQEYGCGPEGLIGILAGTVPKLEIKLESSYVNPNVPHDWWEDIRYFKRAEFRCPCPRCGGFPAEPVEKLVRIADAVRGQAGRPAHVSSGVRCAAHNAELPNSSATSRHMKGWAMDFCVEGMTSTQLDALVGAQPGVAYHYKIDGSYVHMDVVI